MNSYCCQQSLCRQQFFQVIVWWHMTSQHVATHHCDSLMVYHIIYFNLYHDWIRRLWGIYLWILLLPNFSPLFFTLFMVQDYCQIPFVISRWICILSTGQDYRLMLSLPMYHPTNHPQSYDCNPLIFSLTTMNTF